MSETNNGTPAAPAAPAPAVDPTFQQPPVGTPQRPAPPPTIPLTVDEYQRLRGLESQYNEAARLHQAAIEAAQAKENEALAAKGQIEEAFASERSGWQAKLQGAEERLAGIKQRYYGEKVNATLAEAFNGLAFSGADDSQRAEQAKMLRSILSPELDVIDGPEGATFVVDKASRRPAADVLRERLSDPKLAFFFAPTSRGGSGTDGARPPASQQQSQPGSLESIAANFNAQQGQYPAFGLTRKA